MNNLHSIIYTFLFFFTKRLICEHLNMVQLFNSVLLVPMRNFFLASGNKCYIITMTRTNQNVLHQNSGCSLGLQQYSLHIRTVYITEYDMTRRHVIEMPIHKIYIGIYIYILYNKLWTIAPFVNVQPCASLVRLYYYIILIVVSAVAAIV